MQKEEESQTADGAMKEEQKAVKILCRFISRNPSKSHSQKLGAGNQMLTELGLVSEVKH